MTYWKLKGREMANCNCEYGCNCQFGGLPDKGGCQAVFGMDIEEGFHGDTDLSGLKVAAAFVDERATDEQRKALLTIMTGGDTDPFATVFAVFAAMVETFHEPQFVPIEFDVDVEGRTARLRVDGKVEMDGVPIRSIVSGEPIKAQIRLEGGFEYEVAEIGSGTSRSISPIAFAHANSYGQFAHLHLDSHGIVHA